MITRRSACRAGLLLAGPLLAGCSGPASSTPPPTSSAATAQAAVSGYLDAVGRHDAAGARSFVAPEYRDAVTGSASAFADQVADVVGLRVTDGPTSGPALGLADQFRDYPQLAECAVTYEVTRRSAIVLRSSRTETRFFVVGARASAGPWLVLSVGTGP